MKKTLLITMIFIITAALALAVCGCYRNDFVIEYSNTGYNNNKAWDKAQGLACDNKYFYYAGHHDKTDENADIHVIDKATYTEVKVLSHVGAMHSAGVEYYPLHDTLLTSSGGNGREPFLYELDKNTGALLNSWDFSSIGENGGANIAVIKDNNIVLFTSSKNGAKIAFTKIALLQDGKFTQEETVFYSKTDLGVPQGFAYCNGKLYYLADKGITVYTNPHYLYVLNSQTFEVEGKAGIKISEETQGITFDGGYLYFGTDKERIYKSALTLSEIEFK